MKKNMPKTSWKKAKNEMLRKDQLLKAIRSAYRTGMHDKENGNEALCRQGSEERAEEILQELIDDGEIEI